MKFKSGDPVWSRVMPGSDSHKRGAKLGEYPTVIRGNLTNYDWWCAHCCSPNAEIYMLESGKVNCGCLLRPRRDDYQQHEPRSTMVDLDRFMHKHRSTKVPTDV